MRDERWRKVKGEEGGEEETEKKGRLGGYVYAWWTSWNHTFRIF